MNTLIIPAATVILMREADHGYEIFIAKRNSRSTFGSIYVFPGGKLDPEDYSEDLYSHCEGLDDKVASEKLDLEKGGLAYWVACIRECFEEAGILLTNTNDPLINNSKKLNLYRDKLNAGEVTFKVICSDEKLRLRASSIVPCAHWITPTIEPKRFDTRFFLAKVDSKQLGMHDGFELTDSFWITPSDALKKSEKGEMNMLPPTIKTIETLSEFQSSDDAFNYFEGLSSDSIPAILPKFIKKDGAWIGYFPGDEGYESV